jgi:integrase
LADLSRKRERDRLPIQRWPHYLKLAEGAYLGFRRGPDTWHARFRDRDHVQHYTALHGIDGNDYDGALRAAETWFQTLTNTAVRAVKRGTVKEALEAYLADLRRHGRPDAAREAQWRFKCVVFADSLAERELERLTREDYLDWRDRISKGRVGRTVNRYVRSVSAALNCAIELGHVGNPAAWRVRALSDDVDEAGETAIFLTVEQRKAIAEAADPATAAFVRGLELTGARPRELAAAVVGDLNGDALRLSHRKGRPARLRARHVILSADGVRFFQRQVAGRLPTDPIFTENGTQGWRRHIWSKQLRLAFRKVNEKARGRARIPAGAGAYSYRHTRISELLQVYGIDPLTVAHQTGTSIAMIEKAYLKFIPQAFREKLSGVVDGR